MFMLNHHQLSQNLTDRNSIFFKSQIIYFKNLN